MRIWFHEWERIACFCSNVIEDFRGDGDEVLHSDERFRDDDDNLHDGGKNVRESVNDDGFSHNDDENEESDGDDVGIHSVRICNDCHGSDDQKVNGDDEGNDRSDDDDSQGHRFRGRWF